MSRTTKTEQPPSRSWDGTLSADTRRLIADLDRRLPGWDRRDGLRPLESNGRRADDEVTA